MSDKQRQSILKMAKFIKGQSLILLEKLNELEDDQDLDQLCTLSEELHGLAERVCNEAEDRIPAKDS